MFFFCSLVLLPRYSIDVYEFWSPKARVSRFGWALDIPKSVSNVSCSLWTSLAVLFALEISYSDTGSYVAGVSFGKTLRHLVC